MPYPVIFPAQIAAQGAASDDEDAGGSLRISVKALEDRAREYNLDDLQVRFWSMLWCVVHCCACIVCDNDADALSHRGYLQNLDDLQARFATVNR